MKTKKSQTPKPSEAELSRNELTQLYAVLQSCSNNANVQPATIHYCRKVKKHVLGHMQAYETDLKELMAEYKVPATTDEHGATQFVWEGMKDEKLIGGLYGELIKQTYQLDNLNTLSVTEFIKHTRGLSESQMDVFEKYLVKAEND